MSHTLLVVYMIQKVCEKKLTQNLQQFNLLKPKIYICSSNLPYQPCALKSLHLVARVCCQMHLRQMLCLLSLHGLQNSALEVHVCHDLQSAGYHRVHEKKSKISKPRKTFYEKMAQIFILNNPPSNGNYKTWKKIKETNLLVTLTFCALFEMQCLCSL